MAANVRNRQLRFLGSAVALVMLAGIVWAAEVHAKPAKIGDYNPADQTVEMFAAIQQGDIAVKLIPKDSTQCQVLIENKTDKPLNVKLPEAFAGVPGLPSFKAAAGGHNTSSSSNKNQNQSMGGGMGGMGGGMGGMGGGGGGMGMFNVPPEKVGPPIKVATVCLEHGKREPRAAIPYEIKPLDSVTAKPGVRELCAMLASGQINQRAAQAAAWHLNNGMSWQELAAKQLRFANGTRQLYFSQAEIQAGMKVAATAVRLSEERPKPESGTDGSRSGK